MSGRPYWQNIARARLCQQFQLIAHLSLVSKLYDSMFGMGRHVRHGSIYAAFTYSIIETRAVVLTSQSTSLIIIENTWLFVIEYDICIQMGMLGP